MFESFDRLRIHNPSIYTPSKGGQAGFTILRFALRIYNKNMSYKIIPAFSFDFLTPFYDPITELLGFGGSFKRNLVRKLNLQNGESLLDVGCGTGSLLLPAKHSNPKSRVVGIDPDQRVLDIAKRKIQRAELDIELTRAFGEDLPFEDSSFDVVVSALVYHHLPTVIKRKAMSEVYRVLKKGGRFLLADLGKPENTFWRIVLSLESIFEEAEYVRDNLDGKLPLFLEEAGFRVEEMLPKYRGVQFLLARK